MPFDLYVDAHTFGRWVREQRKLRGMTQNALAAAVGIAPSILCRIEHGRRSWAATQVAAWLQRDDDRILRARAIRAESEVLRQAHATLKVQVRQVLAESHRLQTMLLQQCLSAADQATLCHRLSASVRSLVVWSPCGYASIISRPVSSPSSTRQ